MVRPEWREATKKMDAYELKRRMLEANPHSHFFDRKTMRFFGDTMKNFGVRGPFEVTDVMGDKFVAYELYRRQPVKHGLQKSHYIDSVTFKIVHI